MIDKKHEIWERELTYLISKALVINPVSTAFNPVAITIQIMLLGEKNKTTRSDATLQGTIEDTLIKAKSMVDKSYFSQFQCQIFVPVIITVVIYSLKTSHCTLK